MFVYEYVCESVLSLVFVLTVAEKKLFVYALHIWYIFIRKMNATTTTITTKTIKLTTTATATANAKWQTAKYTGPGKKNDYILAILSLWTVLFSSNISDEIYTQTHIQNETLPIEIEYTRFVLIGINNIVYCTYYINTHVYVAIALFWSNFRWNFFYVCFRIVWVRFF